MDQGAFDAALAYLMTNFPAWGAQVNSTQASMGIIAGGGANKIPYKVDLGTTMADPTAGWLRLNSATQNAATAMVVDLVGSDNVDYTSLLYTFDDSTSLTSLGQIRVEKMADASKFLVFNLTAMSTPAGYRQFTVTCTGSSSANPFAQGDSVVLSFQRTGDRGDYGPTYLQLISTTTITTPVAALSFLSNFDTSTYNKFTIDIEGLYAASAGSLTFGLATGGALNSTLSYYGLLSDAGAPNASTTFTGTPTIGSAVSQSFVGSIEISNPGNASSPTVVTLDGYSSGFVHRKGGMFTGGAVTGFRLACSGGNLAGGTVRIYGWAK
jgi:hypothetical protein